METLSDLILDASDALGAASERSRELEQRLVATSDEPEERYWLMEWAHAETIRQYAKEELIALIF